MKAALMGFVVAFATSLDVLASADTATIGVGNIVVVRDAPPSIYEEQPERPKDPYRAPFRLTIGPAAITSGQGVGPGLLAAADFGTGAVGFRLSAAWFRGEAAGDSNARLGNTIGLYAGELVLDLHKNGPFHPVAALGLGALNIGKDPNISAWALAGLGRIGFEYSIAIEDADVRFGVGLTGGLLGPADDAISSVRAFAMLNTTFSIGF